MSRQELADSSGVSRRRIEELETRDHGIRPETARSLAQALGCEPGDLVQIIED
jgi:DNA-binding Xre family transcriptional regulator